MEKHTCHTYVRMVANDRTAEAAIEAFLRENGIAFGRHTAVVGIEGFEAGRNDVYDVDVNVMLRKTLAEFFGKESALAALQRDFAAEVFLVVVPHIVAGSDEPTPILGPDPDIVAFLYAANVVYDLDYYIE